MEYISWDQILNFSLGQNNVKIPTSVNIHCPHCGMEMNFSLGWSGSGLVLDTYATVRNCTACSGKVVFFYTCIEITEKHDRKGDLFIYPKSKKRSPVYDLDRVTEFPNQLKEEYYSALRVFNMKEHIASAVMCRRILEGLIQNLTPTIEHKKTLYQQILNIDQHVELKKPIIDIADGVRIVGNQGAHFNNTRPTRETLELVFDLIDFLIEYFYVLPDKTQALHNHFIKVDTDKSK